MAKGTIGTSTFIISTPKRKKVKCNCKICMNFRKNVCYLGKPINTKFCKWFAKNDYILTKSESTQIKKQNKRKLNR